MTAIVSPIRESYIKEDGTGFIGPQFLTDWPMFHTIKGRFFRPEGADPDSSAKILAAKTLAEALETQRIAFDAFCPGCGKGAHFVAVSGDADKIARHRAAAIRLTAQPPPDHGIYARMFYCYRSAQHFIYVVALLDERGLTKIGQFPSASDLTLDDSRRYEEALGDEKADEMIKASIAATFGFSIGAFVYARRVFESLIDGAEEEAKAAGKAPEYDSATPYPPMRERIEKLADYLPPLLVKHAHLYNVMSEGIHALSEEKCARYFPTVREGIELILQQHEERDARAAAEKKFAAKIGVIRGEISGGKS